MFNTIIYIIQKNYCFSDAPMQSFVELKLKNPSLKLLVAAGGYADDPRKFSDIAADPIKRQNFAQSVLNFVQTWNLDGFDFNWVYPVSRGDIGFIDVNDKDNFILQLQEFRNSLDSHSSPLSLSASAAAGQYQASQSYNIPQFAAIVDFINLMAYDLHGAW